MDEERRLRLLKDAREAAQHAAKMLVEQFGAERVYLFGSLLDEDDFTKHSDIDIAVDGLKTELYFKALHCIWDVMPKGVSLDLVPIEDAKGHVKSKILTAGVALYEKQSAHS